jgi:hypothetical protein
MFDKLQQIKVYCGFYDYLDHVNLDDLNWLIRQAEILREITDLWVAIEINGTVEDRENFHKIVRDVLAKKFKVTIGG